MQRRGDQQVDRKDRDRDQDHPPAYDDRVDLHQQMKAMLEMALSGLESTPQARRGAVLAFLLVSGITAYSCIWEIKSTIPDYHYFHQVLVFFLISIASVFTIFYCKLVRDQHAADIRIKCMGLREIDGEIVALRGTTEHQRLTHACFLLGVPTIAYLFWLMHLDSASRAWACCTGLVELASVYVLTKSIRDQSEAEYIRNKMQLQLRQRASAAAVDE